MTQLTVPESKLVVALNKRLPPGIAANAACHAVLGLATGPYGAADEANRPAVLDFATADGVGFRASASPLVVLRASRAHLHRLRNELLAHALPAVAFHEEMVGETWREQLTRSATRDTAEVELFAVATFGAAHELDPLTRRLSLY